MNLEQALNFAKTSDYAHEAIASISKQTDGKYYLMLVTHDAQEQWFVVHYELGLIPPGTSEDDAFCGDNYAELVSEVSQNVDVSSLSFHAYPVAPGNLMGLEMPHILRTLFPNDMPDPEIVIDWHEYETRVANLLATLS